MTSSFVSLEVNYQVFLKKNFFCGFSTTYDFSQIEKKKYSAKIRKSINLETFKIKD